MTRILLIEDDEALRSLTKSVLEREGYAVDEAVHGKEGLVKFRANPANLVITDLLMPVQEGFQTIIELTKEFPDVKIIAISGSIEMVNIDLLPAAKGFGALRTLGKPISAQVLIQNVREVLES